MSYNSAKTSPRIVVLASGSGTTAEVCIRKWKSGEMDTEIVAVVCNNKTAGIFERISNINTELGVAIETHCINGKTHPTTENEICLQGEQTTAEQQAIIDIVNHYQADGIVLMGYLKKIGHKLIEKYGWLPHYTTAYQACMLNTHAGLLPDTKGFFGNHKEEEVLKQGYKESGVTLHLVAADYDDGPILNEHRQAVLSGDTVESLAARDQALEKSTLPGNVDTFFKARINYMQERE